MTGRKLYLLLGDNYPVCRVASPVNVTFLLQLKCYHQHEFRNQFSDHLDPPFLQPALQCSAMAFSEFTRMCVFKFEK